LKKNYKVWLFGSRANGTSDQNSDWDFIVFGDDDLFLEVEKKEKPENLDLWLFLRICG